MSELLPTGFDTALEIAQALAEDGFAADALGDAIVGQYEELTGERLDLETLARVLEEVAS